jgi:arylsulfatase
MIKNKLSLGLLTVSLLPLSAQNKQEIKPNIIIIYCDDLGYGDVGINGHPTIRTPNLDKMTMNGIRFTNYYSA